MSEIVEELPTHTDDGRPIAYREIAHLAGYFVGDDGAAWSHRRVFGRPPNGWRRLRPARHRSGYLAVAIRAPGQQNYRGKTSTFYIHRLVLESFVGPCPDGMECCHTNGNPEDNRLENLRWDTPRANQADSKRHGTLSRGERKGGAKLREEDIPLLRQLVKRGFTCTRVAALFGVSDETVKSAACGETWSHVPFE